MRAALFDLDSTLIDCNSGRLWLEHEWRDGRVGWRAAVWASFELVKYGLGSDVEDAYAKAVATLAGTEERFIAERTTAWFERYVRGRLRPGARGALEVHRAAGDRLVLATSGSVYSAAAACAAYGLDDAIASRYEVVDGRFTGRIASSAFGRAKAERVVEWAAAHEIDLAECAFYTDSVTDLALMEAVGRPVAVNPDRRLRKVAASRRWRIEDWGRSA